MENYATKTFRPPGRVSDLAPTLGRGDLCLSKDDPVDVQEVSIISVTTSQTSSNYQNQSTSHLVFYSRSFVGLISLGFCNICNGAVTSFLHHGGTLMFGGNTCAPIASAAYFPISGDAYLRFSNCL
jgi:hypothetical protein